MEQDFDAPLAPLPPALYIDPQIRHFLSEAAKWGKFLAIVGFVFLGIAAIMALFIGTLFGSLTAMGAFANSDMPGIPMLTGGIITILILLLVILYFFPILYLYLFSSKMQVALRNDDQATLVNAFKFLRANLRFLGILMIVLIAFYVLQIFWAITMLT